MPTTTASTPGPSEPSVPLHPIHDDEEYEHALREVERLWDAPPGSPEDDRLQVLVLLISAYEQEHIPIPPPEPVDAIRFRMEQRNLTAADLASLLGVSRRRVLAMLRGAPLTLSMIRLLVERLDISAEVLVRQPAGASGGSTYARDHR
jgi:HTH-type transcriptional regulator/antitoxin HigA